MDKANEKKQNIKILVIASIITFILMLLFTTKSSLYGRKDYYSNHPNSSKTYEEWTQEREFINKTEGNY